MKGSILHIDNLILNNLLEINLLPRITFEYEFVHHFCIKKLFYYLYINTSYPFKNYLLLKYYSNNMKKKKSIKTKQKSIEKNEKQPQQDFPPYEETLVLLDEPIALSEKDYLIYLEHAFHYMPLHLIGSHQIQLLLEYYTCPRMLLKHINLCCAINEREEYRAYYLKEENKKTKKNDFRPSMIFPSVNITELSDPILTHSDLISNIHFMDSSTLFSNRCNYSYFLEYFSALLMRFIGIEDRTNFGFDKPSFLITNSNEELNSKFHISESSIEFLKWIFTVLRTEHFGKVLRKRPEEFPSLLTARLMKDLDSGVHRLASTNVNLNTNGNSQALNLNIENPYIEWMSDTNGSLDQLSIEKQNVNIELKSSQFFLHTSSKEVNQLITKIQDMQQGKSWLIPFNRLTGMPSTKKYNDALEGGENVSSIHISPKDSHIYYVRNTSEGGDVVIVDRFFGSKIICPDKFYNNGDIKAFSLTSKGDRIILAFEDATIKVLDAINGMEYLSITGLIDKPTCGKASLDGKLFFVACGSYICIYDLENGELVETLRGHTDVILCMDINNEFLVTGGQDNLIIKWKLRTRSIDLKIKTQYDYYVGCISINEKSNFIVSVENNRYYADVWCANTGSHKHFLMDRGTVKQIVMDSSRDRLLTVMEDKIWLWNIKSAMKIARINITKKIKHTEISRDGQTVFILYNDATISSVSLNGGDPNYILDEKHSHNILDLALCTSGKKTLILSIAQKESNVYVWGFDDGILLKKVEFQSEYCEHLCFSNKAGLLLTLDQSLVATEGTNTETLEGRCLRCYDIVNKDRGLLWSIYLTYNTNSKDHVQSMLMSPDDKYVIISYTNDIVLVPMEAPAKFFNGFIESKEQIRGITLSLDFDEIVTSDTNGYIRKWSISEQCLTQKLQVGRWRRNKCQCIYLLGETNFLVVGSPQYTNWITVQEKSQQYPKSIFTRKDLNLEYFVPNEFSIQEIDNSEATLQQQHKRICHNFSATKIALINERYIVTGDNLGCIRVWDMEKKLFICSYTLQSACTALKVILLPQYQDEDDPIYVLLAGDSDGNVVSLEICL